MIINKLNLIFFSPTNTTQKIIVSIAEGLAIDTINNINLTYPESETFNYSIAQNQVSIIGVPVYGGRVPRIAVKRLQKIKAENSLAILVVLYGNREFEDSLLELKNLAKESGFIAIAAGAFIGEHSYSLEDKPIAHGRPNQDDLEIAKDFGRQVKTIITALETFVDIPELEVPGNSPYKELKKGPEFSPETNKLKCINCGICIEICPARAINIDVSTNKEECIWCCACIKKCPENARYMDNEFVSTMQGWLIKNYSEPKEPETFINIAKDNKRI